MQVIKKMQIKSVPISERHNEAQKANSHIHTPPSFTCLVEEVGDQKSEVRSQRSEVRSQRSEVRDRRSEIGDRRSEIRQKTNEERERSSSIFATQCLV